jgi:mono/diheme cytochrome c family protein
MQQSLKIFAVLFALSPAQSALAQDKADATAGAEVYATNCAQCHGERLANSGGIPDLRRLSPADKEKFETVVNEGKGQMPAWGGILSDEEIGQVWAYIRSRAD